MASRGRAWSPLHRSPANLLDDQEYGGRPIRGSIDGSNDRSPGVSAGRQANASSSAPEDAGLCDADIVRAGGSRRERKGAGSAVLHGADFRSHCFQPGRDRDEKRSGAQYRHVRALRQRRQNFRAEHSEQASHHSRTVLGGGRQVYSLSARHGATRGAIGADRLSTAQIR